MTRPDLSAATQVVGVIGAPVAHSLSPLLHNAAFAAAGLDWVSLGFPVPLGAAHAAVGGAAALGVRGLSVTMPFKEEVVAATDRLTPSAERLGAVNCLRFVDGTVEGGNTDGIGFVDALAAEHGFSPVGQRCVVIGAGGAARAVAAALADAGASEVVVVNRTAARAEAAAAVTGPAGRVGDLHDVPEAAVVVNATPQGMDDVAGTTGWPVDPELLHPGQLVCDLIYHPAETAWLAAAATRGCTTGNGLAMLVHQAAHQLTWWTGLPIPVDALWAAIGRTVTS